MTKEGFFVHWKISYFPKNKGGLMNNSKIINNSYRDIPPFQGIDKRVRIAQIGSL